MRMTANPIRFSLLLSTVVRVGEVERLLDSLVGQTYTCFELIVVDQNEDDRLGAILARFAQTLTIHHVRSPRGLSRARNAGLPHCQGDIIALPDDDCWYPPDLLENVVRAFTRMQHVDFFAGRAEDGQGRDSQARWSRHPRPISARNAWHCAISFAIFFRRGVMERVGEFDERLGVGSGTPWGAGEETDYVLRALNVGARGFYEPSCVVYHPQPVITFDERSFSRARSYSRGMGFVLRKHGGGAHAMRLLGRPLAGAALAFATLRFAKAKFHWLVFKGRCLGYLDI